MSHFGNHIFHQLNQLLLVDPSVPVQIILSEEELQVIHFGICPSTISLDGFTHLMRVRRTGPHEVVATHQHAIIVELRQVQTLGLEASSAEGLDGAGKRDRLQPSQIFIVEGLEEELRVALLQHPHHLAELHLIHATRIVHVYLSQNALHCLETHLITQRTDGRRHFESSQLACALQVFFSKRGINRLQLAVTHAFTLSIHEQEAP
mmetsp:Transcript_11933/g.26299  ORF Transcript_11933/g.26299 Transcript_11933/m.26299 type:complete len:206 (-) Transcript_11933:188-805(-)